MSKRFQFVWWGWRYAMARPWFAYRDIRWSRIYRYSLHIGPIEIRRWDIPEGRP